MKAISTVFLSIACFAASAQSDIDYPYNPDFENDGFVGIEDVLELLSVYGTPFTPEQLLLDGSSLTEIIESLQSQIDSLASYTNEGFGAIALNDSLLTEYLVGVAAASEEGDSTLGAWVMQLSEVVEQQQAQIDSLALGNNLGQFNMGLSEHLSLQEQATQFYGLNWFHFEFEDDGFLTASTTEHSFFFRIPKTVEVDFSDEQFLAALFDSTNGYPANEGMGTYTIPLSSQEQLILAFDTQDENPFAYWTPLTSATTEVDDPIQAGPCQGEFTINYHGYDYELVEIGDQCWFAENLRTTSYRNGEAISNENSYLESSSDAWNELNQLSPLVEGEEGHFYSLGVIQSGLDVCPSGWSVPSRNDWIHLAAEIDLSLGGHFLKDSTSWNGVDTYGFGAKPAGQAFYQGYDPSWDWQYECSNALGYQSWYQSLQGYLWQTESCIDWEEAVFDPDFPSPCPSLFEEINAVLDSLYTNNIATFAFGYYTIQSHSEFEWLMEGISLAQPCGSYEEAIELFNGGFDYSYQLIEVGQSTIWWTRDASADSYNSGNVRLDGSTRIYGLDSQVDGGLGLNVSIRCIKD
ncbi:MAG: FISUMP domain-containing protein [Flavobacteriales bacterium]